MLIINDKPGQLGNQLWSYAPFIAYCLKHDITFLTLYFEDNYKFFDNLNKFEDIKFGLIKRRRADILLRKILLKSVRHIPDFFLRRWKIFVDKKNWKNESWDEKVFLNNSNLVFIGVATHKKNNSYLKEYHQQLKEIFRPKELFIANAEKIIDSARKKFDTIIGIHIRRGDYKKFLNGVYYFEDEIYKSYMCKILAERELHNKKIGFLLCSNEKINTNNFTPFNIFQIPNSCHISDLYALSLCDYLIGPPSTFSMWSSFYGEVPLRFIKYANENLFLSEFNVIIAQDLFENGTVLNHI